MKNKKKIISVILGLLFGWTINHTTVHKKPPNSWYAKHKTAYSTKDSIEKKNYIVTHVTVSCFQPIKSQCDDDPLTTSDGSEIDLSKLKSGEIRWCAISRDLIYLLPKDKPWLIWIDGYGLYEVKDLMNKRFTHSIDLLIHPKDSMKIRKKNVKVKIRKY